LKRVPQQLRRLANNSFRRNASLVRHLRSRNRRLRRRRPRLARRRQDAPASRPPARVYRNSRRGLDRRRATSLRMPLRPRRTPLLHRVAGRLRCRRPAELRWCVARHQR
jgi:hypothetical protein